MATTKPLVKTHSKSDRCQLGLDQDRMTVNVVMDKYIERKQENTQKWLTLTWTNEEGFLHNGFLGFCTCTRYLRMDSMYDLGGDVV